MRDLRAVALSSDGKFLVLVDPTGAAADAAPASSAAEQYRVPVDDRLRQVLRGGGGRLGQLEVRLESALTPREMQARLRAGESVADIARAAGVPPERVERYEGPVLAERARVVGDARATPLAGAASGSGRPLGEIVDQRLEATGTPAGLDDWDAWRRPDNTWRVRLCYGPPSRVVQAHWTWDAASRRVRPADDAARALGAPREEPGEELSRVADAVTERPRTRPALALAPDLPTTPASNGPDAYAVAETDGPVVAQVPVEAEVTLAPPGAEQPAPESEPQEVRRAGPAATAPATAPDAPAAPAVAAPDEPTARPPGPPDAPAGHPAARPDGPAAPPPTSAADEPAAPPSAPAPDGPATARPGKRGRRADVPAWDDIVFGTRRG